MHSERLGKAGGAHCTVSSKSQARQKCFLLPSTVAPAPRVRMSATRPWTHFQPLGSPGIHCNLRWSPVGRGSGPTTTPHPTDKSAPCPVGALPGIGHK